MNSKQGLSGQPPDVRMAEQSRYILSVDVEDYFQVEAFTKVVPRSDWDRWLPGW